MSLTTRNIGYKEDARRTLSKTPKNGTYQSETVARDGTGECFLMQFECHEGYWPIAQRHMCVDTHNPGLGGIVCRGSAVTIALMPADTVVVVSCLHRKVLEEIDLCSKDNTSYTRF